MNDASIPFSVLILESLYDEDIAGGDLPGFQLAQILNLMGVPHGYHHIDNWLSLSTALAEHAPSHNVLHLSAHGDDVGIHTTMRDELRWGNVVGMLAPHASRKCVVLSACESAAANVIADRLAELLSNDSPNPKVTRFLRALDSTPPEYLITYDDSPEHAHDTLTLGVFYAHLAAAGERWVDDQAVATALASARAAGLARIVGRRHTDGLYAPLP